MWITNETGGSSTAYRGGTSKGADCGHRSTAWRGCRKHSSPSACTGPGGSAQHLANRRGFMPGGCSWVVLLHPAVHPEVAPMGTRGHGRPCSQHSAAAQAAPEGTNPAKCWPTGQETHAHPKEMALHPPNLITPRLSQQCSSFWVGSFPVSYARVRAQA